MFQNTLFVTCLLITSRTESLKSPALPTYVSKVLSRFDYNIIRSIPQSLNTIPVDGQCGTWLNHASNTPGLLDPDESFPTFISSTLYNEDWLVE
jgi:hypothetical protein